MGCLFNPEQKHTERYTKNLQVGRLPGLADSASPARFLLHLEEWLRSTFEKHIHGTFRKLVSSSPAVQINSEIRSKMWWEMSVGWSSSVGTKVNFLEWPGEDIPEWWSFTLDGQRSGRHPQIQKGLTGQIKKEYIFIQEAQSEQGTFPCFCFVLNLWHLILQSLGKEKNLRKWSSQ